MRISDEDLDRANALFTAELNAHQVRGYDAYGRKFYQIWRMPPGSSVDGPDPERLPDASCDTAEEVWDWLQKQALAVVVKSLP